MAEEKNVASANESGQVDCLELVKKLADSYRCLVRRRELLRQQYEESKSWFYTKDEIIYEKYALRTWLLRLGMNGPDFKETRKILMENLSGHAAFRTDEEAQKFLAREKAKRDALKAAKLAAQNGDPATGETVEQEENQPTQPDCGEDTAQMLEAGA